MGEVGTNGEYHNGSRPPESRDGPSPCGTPEQWYGDIVFADARSNPCDCGGVQGTGTNVQSGQGEYLGPPAIVMGYGSQPQSGSSPWVGEGNNVQSGQGSLDPYDQVGAGHQPQSGEGEPVLTDLYVGGPPGPHSSGHHSPGTANLNVGFDRGFDVFDGGPSDNVPDLTVGGEDAPTIPDGTSNCTTSPVLSAGDSGAWSGIQTTTSSATRFYRFTPGTFSSATIEVESAGSFDILVQYPDCFSSGSFTVISTTPQTVSIDSGTGAVEIGTFSSFTFRVKFDV